MRLFRDAVRVGLAEHRRAPGRKQSKTRNLLERLRDREPEILRFTTDLAVPFTNNGSERDLRPVKTQLRSPAVTAPPPAPPHGYAFVDTSPPSENTVATSSPHYAMQSPETPGSQHNSPQPEWLRSV